MTGTARTIVAGVDGSTSALHAAHWAADEAAQRHHPLRLVYADDEYALSSTASMALPQSYFDGMQAAGSALLAEVETAIRAVHPDLEIGVDLRTAGAVPTLLEQTDVRHDGVTAELKVERARPVTRESTSKYIGQLTQYAAADGTRLSILTILDMSPKLLPIGTPENYLFTLGPQQHGLQNPEAPSIVATLIVNGNMPTPSSWSRRRTPTAPVDPKTL